MKAYEAVMQDMREDRFGFFSDPSIEKLDELPDGWRFMEGTFTQPNGWLWACNGKPMGKGYRKALVKDPRLWTSARDRR